MERLAPRAAINIVVTPLHQITAISVRSNQGEAADGSHLAVGRPYTVLPPEKLQDHGHLAPTNMAARLGGYPCTGLIWHRWGPNYGRGLGLPLGCFTMTSSGTLWPMMVLAKRSEDGVHVGGTYGAGRAKRHGDIVHLTSVGGIVEGLAGPCQSTRRPHKVRSGSWGTIAWAFAGASTTPIGGATGP